MNLEDLYKFGKLQSHLTSPEEIKGLFEICHRGLKDAAQTNISLDLRFISAYQAGLVAAEALLYCFGYKAPKGNYHYMTWEGIRNIDDDYLNKTIVLFNNARQKRAEAFYDHAGAISESEFTELFKESKIFVNYIKNKIKREFPKLSKKI